MVENHPYVVSRQPDTIDAVPSISRLRHKLGRTWLRSRLVDRRLKFLICEFAAAPGRLEPYRLRDNGLTLYLRHRTQDLGTLDEVFVSDNYKMPEAIRSRLEAGDVSVVDFGANIGLFGIWVFSEFPNARLTAFEPDPLNAEVLARCIAANQLESRWELRTECVSNTSGLVSFDSGRFAESRVVANGNATVPQVDFFEVIGDSTLIKLDVEGSEWPILRDPRLRDIRADAIVLEWHRTDGLDHSEASAAGCLREAGFVLATVIKDDDAGTMWAWQDTP